MASDLQEQTDRDAAVLRLVRPTLKSHPIPPRPVDGVRVALASYCGKLFPLLLLTGTGAALFVITFFQSGSPATLWFLRFLTGGGALFFLVGPALNGMTVARWVRDGLLASADVIEISVANDRHDGNRGHGRRIVHHPTLGDFREDFLITAQWISSVTPGSTLQVLVAPNEAKSWITVGVQADGAI